MSDAETITIRAEFVMSNGQKSFGIEFYGNKEGVNQRLNEWREKLKSGEPIISVGRTNAVDSFIINSHNILGISYKIISKSQIGERNHDTDNES